MEHKHRVVVIGGGFGGLRLVQTLKDAPVEITLIDRRNFHLFQPLLYQVATGALSPADIAAPLRGILSHQKNVRTLLGEATGIDATRRHVIMSDGEVPYDTLVVATGATHHYFGNDQWAELAPGLKTIEDATEIRRRMMLAFEAAERETDPERLEALMTFIVVGAGPTGVEMAGSLAEIARDTLRDDFRRIHPENARIILLEGLENVLNIYPDKLSGYARRTLERLGVDVRLKTLVTNIEPDRVTVKSGDQVEVIRAHTVVWGAGVRGSRMGKILQETVGAPLDKVGRVIVEPDCSIPGHPEIFVVGDLANFSHTRDGKPLPGVAPVAKQQGVYVARQIKARLQGKHLTAFKYFNMGSMATIGRGAAVADLRVIRFTGYLGWLAWLFVHLMQLVDFQNRVLVLMQWAWQYWTRNRSARLVTGESPFPLVEAPEDLEQISESAAD